jgi:hypothetical protein
MGWGFDLDASHDGGRAADKATWMGARQGDWERATGISVAVDHIKPQPHPLAGPQTAAIGEGQHSSREMAKALSIAGARFLTEFVVPLLTPARGENVTGLASKK